MSSTQHLPECHRTNENPLVLTDGPMTGCGHRVVEIHYWLTRPDDE